MLGGVLMHSRKVPTVPAHFTQVMKKRFTQKHNRNMNYWEKRWQKKKEKSNQAQVMRLLKFHEDLDTISIGPNASVDETLDKFVEIINIVTTFFDNGKIQFFPRNTVDIKKFNIIVKNIVRREKAIFGYKNISEPHERVTDKNLLIGDATEVSSKSKVSNFIKEIDGKKYKIVVSMTPISMWKNKRVRRISGKGLRFNYGVYIKQINLIKEVLFENIDRIINSL